MPKSHIKVKKENQLLPQLFGNMSWCWKCLWAPVTYGIALSIHSAYSRYTQASYKGNRQGVARAPGWAFTGWAQRALAACPDFDIDLSDSVCRNIYIEAYSPLAHTLCTVFWLVE